MNPPLRERRRSRRDARGHRRRQRRRDRHRPRAAPLRREEGRVRPRAVRHRRARDGVPLALDRLVHAGLHRPSQARRAAVGRTRRASSTCPAGTLVEGALADITILAPDLPVDGRAVDVPLASRRTRRSADGSCVAASPPPSSAAARSTLMGLPMERAASSSLRTRLDTLYASFNYAESAADPIQIVRRYPDPADREIVGFCAAALAFGRVASVLQSIERLTGDPGAVARAVRPRVRPEARRPRRQANRSSMDPRRGSHCSSDHAPANAGIGVDRIVLCGGLRRTRARRGRRSGIVFSAGDEDRRARSLPGQAVSSGRRVLLSESFQRQRLQTAESLPALDGAIRRGRSRRLVGDSAPRS